MNGQEDDPDGGAPVWPLSHPEKEEMTRMGALRYGLSHPRC